MAVSRFNPENPDAGLRQVVPTSVVVGSGSGSVDGNGAVTFSGASSIAINGCFSSTYDNYKMIFTTTSSSANLNVNMRLRVSGTSNSGSNYNANGSVSASTTLSNINTNATSLFLTDVYSSIAQFSLVTGDILLPNTTQYTRYAFQTYGENSSGQNTGRSYAGVHDVSTAYDGIELIASTGNITGTLRVYGYRN